MRSSAFVVLGLSLVAAAKPVVDPYEGLTNAQRLSRGLPLAKPKFKQRGEDHWKPKPSLKPTKRPGHCKTGEPQCCSSIEKASDSKAKEILGLLRIHISDADTVVGLHCSPLDIADKDWDKCKSKPVCCENNKFDGLISIGCTPTNVSL